MNQGRSAGIVKGGRMNILLEESIEKWEKIVNHEGRDDGSENCSLCNEYNNEETDQDYVCEGCPVSIKVDETGCLKTPWEEWFDHQRSVHNYEHIPDEGFKVECNICKELANKELEFLKSLREKEG